MRARPKGMIYRFGSNFDANSFLNCLGHDDGGAMHRASVLTKAQTFSSPFLEQMTGFVWRHPAVCVSVSSIASGK